MSAIWAAIKFGWRAYQAIKTVNPALIDDAVEMIKNVIKK